MKLFWKLFCSMVLITALACSAGGYALIHAQFRASLDREVAALYEENDLLRFALAQELAFNPLYSREELAKAAGASASPPARGGQSPSVSAMRLERPWAAAACCRWRRRASPPSFPPGSGAGS